MKSSTARWLGMSLALAAGSLSIGPGVHAQEQEIASKAPAKIEPWVLENTRTGAQAEFIVVLEKQADLAAAAKLKSKLSKGRFVYETLFQTAEESQKPIRALLDARGVEYRPFYLVNAILVKGDRALAQTLAARSDVRRIDGNPEMRQALPEPESLEAGTEGLDVWTGTAILTAEPGITYVRAPQVWKGNFGAVKRVFDPIAKDVKQYEHGKELVPGITAIEAHPRDIGHDAGRALLDILGGMDVPSELRRREPTIALRGSTAGPVLPRRPAPGP